MKKEIERKFLVEGDAWRKDAGEGLHCCQGYLCSGMNGATVRVRRMGSKGFLTVKGPSQGISRSELEYPIPVSDAEYMMQHLCGGRLVSKIRYAVRVGGLIWEIDQFCGMNEGLIIAEVELEQEDQTFDKPGWAGAEVTSDSRYSNAALAGAPFAGWASR